MATVFDGLAKRGIEITVDKQQIKIRPAVKDLEPYLDKNADNKLMISSFVNMIANANPEATKEDIEAYVVTNIGELLVEIPVALKLIKREDIQKKLEANISASLKQ